jgi:hypothetical protein
VGGTTYHYYKNTFYREVIENGQKGYVVVQKPQGMTMLMALPAEFEIIQAASGASYFAHQGTYYLPYLDITGQEVYIVVDPPPPPPQAAPSPAVTADVSGTEMVERSVNIPTGTQFSIRIAKDVSSETAQSGERFTGYLDTELKVGELLAAPRGSKVYGTVAEAQKAGSMSGQAKLVLVLTDLQVNGRVISLVTNRYVIEGKSSSQDTGRKVVGGAGLGAMIGAIADGGSGAWKGAVIGAGVGTAASAATEGDQVAIYSQTKIEFALEQPLVVPYFVHVVSSGVAPLRLMDAYSRLGG